MTKFIIQWQDQFGKWHRLQEKHNAADAFRTAQQRARSTGKRHRLVDESGALLDIVNPLDAVETPTRRTGDGQSCTQPVVPECPRSR